MKLLNRIIDWLQATFPPNRLAILLAGIITAVSGTIAAWLATHFPGISLGAAEIAGVLGAAVLITIRLLDRWLDQWQKGEPIAVHPDVEAALEELSDSPDVHDLFSVLGSLEGTGQAIATLRAAVEAGTLRDDEIVTQLGSVGDAIAGVLHEHQAEHPTINAETGQEA